jgi:hypothetical protein
MRQMQTLALLSRDLHRKSVVPIVQTVPVVAVVEDVPEVIILPELWRKTSGIVPDFAHTLFVVGESGTAYEINFSTSD